MAKIRKMGGVANYEAGSLYVWGITTPNPPEKVGTGSPAGDSMAPGDFRIRKLVLFLKEGKMTL
jgi:hypothetical protein